MANFWYNGFLIIWNGGIRDLYFAAKNKYPNYEVWVIGHSMGGNLAGNAAAWAMPITDGLCQSFVDQTHDFWAVENWKSGFYKPLSKSGSICL